MGARIATVPAVLILLGVSAENALADTWHINPEGTGDFPTLFATCQAAADGDTILLSSGYYDESGPNIHLVEKGLAIIGAGPMPDAAILRVSFYYGDSQGCLLENLTIRDSDFPINMWDSNVTMRACVFRRNWNAQTSEAPISCYGSDVLIEDCVFANNYSQDGIGGAIRGGTLSVKRSLFVDNTADLWGGAIDTSQNSTIEDCVFFRNTAPTGAAVAIGGHVILTGCTFMANEVTGHHGGTIALTSGQTEVVSHCVIAGTVNGYAMDCQGDVGNFACCNTWANDRGPSSGGCFIPEELGNFSSNPMFCDPETGDVGLLPGSPCLPGNHGGYECSLIGAKGLGCGEVPVREMTWGGLKILYR